MQEFVLLGQQKCGTKVLQGFLNDHNYIECFDELLMQKSDYSDAYEHLEEKGMPVYDFYHDKFGFDDYEKLDNYLDTFFSNSSFDSKNRVHYSRGFLVHYNLFSEELASYLEFNDIKLLHIEPDLIDYALREVLKESEQDKIEADLAHVEEKAKEIKPLVYDGLKNMRDGIDKIKLGLSDIKPTKKTNRLSKPVREDIQEKLNLRNDVISLEEKPDLEFDIKDKINNYKFIQRKADI